MRPLQPGQARNVEFGSCKRVCGLSIVRSRDLFWDSRAVALHVVPREQCRSFLWPDALHGVPSWNDDAFGDGRALHYGMQGSADRILCGSQHWKDHALS